jgi:hypothetical protein
MPHIDDGVLHAYLDGALAALGDAGALPEGMAPGDVIAHLEQCADCRSRLELERSTRERAGMVLRDAGPQRVHTPPLAATDVQRRRGSWLPLAWAASLVLAVGAGWWGNRIGSQYVLQEQSVMESADLERGDASSGSAPRATAAPAAAPTPDGPQTRQNAFDAAARSHDGAPERRAAVPETEIVLEPTLADTVPQSLAAREASVARTQQADAAQVATRSAQAAAAETSRPLAAAPPPPAVRLETMTSELQAHALPYSAFSGQAGDPLIDAAVTAFVARDSAGQVFWREANAQQQLALRSQMFALSDGADLGFDVALEIGTQAGRVRQRLENDEHVEVVTWEQHQVRLDELAVTGAASRSESRDSTRAGRQRGADAQAKAAGDRVVPLSERALPDGRIERLFAAGSRRIIVRAPATLSAEQVRERLQSSGR